MTPDQALRAAKNFRRYRIPKRKGDRSVWDQSGEYVPQKLVPMATRKQRKSLDRVMGGGKNKMVAIRWVDVHRIRSTQICLRHRSLIWNVRNFEKTQKTFPSKDLDIKGINLPMIVWVDGTPVIWNGNHRVTASILLGKKRILVRMYKLRRPRW